MTLELRLHGRGGQGTVLAAKILAEAVLRSGRGECMAIPEFGVERRGAPVVAYARISDGRILLRSRIYAPDALVLFDPTLAAKTEILQGLKPGGVLVVNHERDPASLSARWPGYRVLCVPASRIAVSRRLGSAASPVVNTAMCGAAVAAFDLADPASLEAAVRGSVPVKAQENAEAAREAYLLVSELLHAQAR